MTIDSGWVQIFKKEVPSAFVQMCPFRPKVAYIDGMPLLMVAEGRVSRWNDYVRSNFVQCILRMFRLGCEAVVLAFDEYDYVPRAKSITQANRTKAKASYEFGEGCLLPPTMPDKFNDKLANRVFKRRVIDMICNSVVQHISHMDASSKDRAFIIDYSNCPIRFACEAGSTSFSASQPDFMTSLAPMGEADVKFLRWAELFQGDILAYSVDGDFIPIALIRYERNRRNIEGGIPYRLALYRLKCRLPEKKLSGTKRTSVEPPTTTTTIKKKNAREYEYVNIPLLYEGLCHKSTLTTDMNLVAVMIALSGTDFTRSMPQIGPSTLWSMLNQNKDIFKGLLKSFDHENKCLIIEEACNRVAAPIYASKYASHMQNQTSSKDITVVTSMLKGSRSLSEKTKNDIPSPLRLQTTFKNINWLLQYWQCRDPVKREAEGDESSIWDYSSCYPDPIHEDYGFSTHKSCKGRVVWSDEAEISNKG
jgi:hypothetical protein